MATRRDEQQILKHAHFESVRLKVGKRVVVGEGSSNVRDRSISNRVGVYRRRERRMSVDLSPATEKTLTNINLVEQLERLIEDVACTVKQFRA